MEHSTSPGTPVYAADTIVRIYGLIDPRTGLLRYVGKTKKSLAVRLHCHIKDARRGRERPNHRLRWLRKLLAMDLAPSIVLIEECWGDGGREECFHIRFAMADGCRLVNSTDGGDGPMWVSDELREKLSAAARGRKHTPEVKAACAAAMRERWRRAPESERRRLRELGLTHQGKKRSDEAKVKLRAARRAIMTPEFRRQMSERMRGTKWSESRRDKGCTIAGWFKGKKFSPEHIAKMSARMKGQRAPNRKFNDATEAEIIQKYLIAGHCSATKAIAAEYGVAFQLISDILRRHKVRLHEHSMLPHQTEKMRLKKIGTKQSAETIEKRFRNIRGVKRGPISDEHRRNLSESHKGKKQIAELVAKRNARLKSPGRI